MTDAAKTRMQNDIENICQMAHDDINGALWHFGVNKQMAADSLRVAIENIKTAILLIEEG